MLALEAIWCRIEDEPVIATTLVGAFLDLVIVFGAPITDDQKTALVVFTTALLALFARSRVMPV